MITSVVSTKGGVGKSLITLNLAAAAAESGAKVLMIDADPQFAITEVFGNRVDNAEKYKLLSFDLKSTVNFLELQKVVAASHADYDEVYIDTPGFDCPFVWQIVSASDLAIIPIAAGFTDIRIAVQVANKIHHIRQTQHPSLQLRGIRNAYRANTNIALTVNLNLQSVSEILPELSSVLTLRALYADAFSYGLGAVEYDKYSTAAKEMRQLYTELVTDFSMNS